MHLSRRRWLAPVTAGAARRRPLHLSELGLARSDLSRSNDFSERAGDAVTFYVERLAWDELRGQALGLIGRQPHYGAVFEQCPIEVPTRSMQLRLDVALRR
jgi:hypothetical protein